MKSVSIIALALLALLPAGCDNRLPDTVPPVISWVYPHDGDTVDPGVYTLVATATDDRQVDYVVFFAYTEMLGMVTTAQSDTYRVAVDCRADTGHAYRLRAFAYDQADNGTSADITIYVRR
jgi:hypothetical protein